MTFPRPAYSRHPREPSTPLPIPGVRSRFSMLSSLMSSPIRLIFCLEELLNACYICHFGSSCSLVLRLALGTVFPQGLFWGCAAQRALVA